MAVDTRQSLQLPRGMGRQRRGLAAALLGILIGCRGGVEPRTGNGADAPEPLLTAVRAAVDRGEFEHALTLLSSADGRGRQDVEYLRLRNEVLEILGRQEAQPWRGCVLYYWPHLRHEHWLLQGQERYVQAVEERDRGNLTAAIRDFERTRELIAWSPADVDWGDLDERCAAALAALASAPGSDGAAERSDR